MTITVQIQHADVQAAIKESFDELRCLSIPQAAELLDVSPDTARRLLATGVDLGGKGYKVRLSDVRRLIAERTIKL